MLVKTQLHSKLVDLKELKKYGAQQTKTYEVAEVITLTDVKWKEFTNKFMADHKFLDRGDGYGKNGILIVQNKKGDRVVVDTQGYLYARYAGVVKEVIE